MKRLFYLLLGIVLVCSLRVNALAYDNLTYSSIQDNVVEKNINPTPITEEDDEYEVTVLPSSDDPNIIIDDEDESGVSLDELPDQPKETVNVKWITMAIILSMLIIGLIIALIVVIKKDKSE